MVVTEPVAKIATTKPPPWHVLTVDAALRRAGSSPQGLSEDEAHARRLTAGPNELAAFEQTSAWTTLATQFKNVLVVILLGATVASALLGEALEAAVIAVIVLFAVALGFVQEYRAGRALDALRKMAAPNAHVVRDGQQHTIPARDVVCGDILRLHHGDRVPADVRIISATNLAIDEAALTGESTAVRKSAAPLASAALPLADRINMGFAGTLVVEGRATALVIGTGAATEFGVISRLVQTVSSGPTPLQQNLDRVGRSLGKAAALIVGVIVGLGLWRGEPIVDMFMFGIALAVAVVPEALPAVVTISLAIGVRRMIKRNALIRRLPTVEALGTISVICSDKTGTLTRNEMTVRQLFVDDQLLTVTGIGFDPTGTIVDAHENPVLVSPEVRELLSAAVLASDARLQCHDGRWSIDGDPTEGALVVAAAKVGIEQEALNDERPRIEEFAFTPERRRMTTVHRHDGELVAYSKGAADMVLPACTRHHRDGAVVEFAADQRRHVMEVEHAMAAQGLRVLAVARKDRVADLQPPGYGGCGAWEAERGLTFLGLVAMLDPAREEAKIAVRRCRGAGITPVIITGDHPLTARSVAAELGLLTGRVVTGMELERMSDAQLAQEVRGISIFARVSPSDKLRVVSAWQQRGAVVAMTGDGVNDAPALKKADVGIAMGITGTDVSKEAAGMTLLDDNFATIVAAIEEGRVVFANIRKYLGYLLSSNVGEIVLMASASIVGAPLPLTAVQILYVNLATDGLPALALAVDPPDGDVMHQRPRDPRRGVLTPSLITLIVVGGLWAGLMNVTLFIGLLERGRPLHEAMALTFTSLVLMEFFKAFTYRSLQDSVFPHVFANRWLDAAVLWELILLAAVIYVTPLQSAFGTSALTFADWATVLTAAATVVPVLEVVKWAQRRAR